MEKTVLRTLGMDRLTWLGSVGCVRVEITTLELDQDTTVSLLHDVTTTDIEQRCIPVYIYSHNTIMPLCRVHVYTHPICVCVYCAYLMICLCR